MQSHISQRRNFDARATNASNLNIEAIVECKFTESPVSELFARDRNPLNLYLRVDGRGIHRNLFPNGSGKLSYPIGLANSHQYVASHHLEIVVRYYFINPPHDAANHDPQVLNCGDFGDSPAEQIGVGHSHMQINHCLALMCDVATYPDRPSSVQIKETHISRVYLTDRYAYKLKKRVQFEFLNFSTPELRHRACLEELRLNRRLAADVYLAVLPITEASDDSLALNGYGQPVDWVVQMRRLPAEQALDVLLYNRRLRPEDWQSIAKHLTDFYTQLQPQPLRAEKFLQDLERRIRANAAALLSSLPNEQLRVHRIHSAQLRYLRLQVEVFTKRVADGHIVEGHGDLRPEHIYVENPPAVIDCIEFSEELRQLDVADELSFLAMACQRLGDGGLGNSVIERYQKSCKDNIPPRLIAFYGAYRACVRAKIAPTSWPAASEGYNPTVRWTNQ